MILSIICVASPESLTADKSGNPLASGFTLHWKYLGLSL